MYCNKCGVLLDDDAVVCGICGAKVKEDTIKVEVKNVNNVNTGRMKNKWIAFILALLGGSLGLHRFYEGKIFTGIIYLLLAWSGVSTFFAVLDMIIILCKPTEYTV
jgi:hypothetical protein